MNWIKQAVIILFLVLLISAKKTHAQGVHFSQFFNSPALLNPANCALMADKDYRLVANYRSQWASVPVPYTTISCAADFSLLKSETRNNWLGLGLSFFNDKAGNGNLSKSKIMLSTAYHLKLGDKNMLSIGMAGGYNNRSVDFTKLSFDTQWDGFTFNTNNYNGESPSIKKTNYFEINAGINYAYFPNENSYLKFGAGVANINRPVESFYGQTNILGIRPTAHFDGFFKTGYNIIINPSIYYSYDKTAAELNYGSLFIANLGGQNNLSYSLILGVFHRWNDAVILNIGMDIGNIRFLASYDMTLSSLSKYNHSQGAFEIGVKWEGNYGKGGKGGKFSCPRFF